MLMIWQNLQKTIALEFERLRRNPVPDFGYTRRPVVSVSLLKAEEAESAVRIEKAVRAYAATNVWLPLNDQDRYFLKQRLLFAHDFLTLATYSCKRPETIIPHRPSGLTDEDAMVWMLIDLWRDSGLRQWIMPFVSLMELRNPARNPQADDLALAQ